MFYNDAALESANLTNWDISNISDLSKLFFNDDQLQKVNLSDWNFVNNSRTSKMFLDSQGNFLKSLQNLDITNTKNIPQEILDAYVKAQNQAGATIIDLHSVSLSPEITSLARLFQNNKIIEHVNMSGMDLSHVTELTQMFDNADNLTSINFSNVHFADNVKTYWFTNAPKITDVKISGAKNVPNDIFDLFISANKKANAKIIDLSNITVAPAVTDLAFKFANMPALEQVNLTNFDTSHVTNMAGMFMNDPNLREIVGIGNLDTSRVTNMSYMFASFKNIGDGNWHPATKIIPASLTKLDLTNWDVHNVENMNSMFQGQVDMQSVGDLSNWDTSKVTDMSNMFSNDYVLKTPGDLSKWQTGKVTDMSYMFFEDYALNNVGDLSNWDVSSVGTKKMAQNYSFAFMFAWTNLNNIGDISKWNTVNVHDTRGMFQGTASLEQLDLSGWNTDNLQIASSMFQGTGAKLINLNGWDFSHLKNFNEYGYTLDDYNGTTDKLSQIIYHGSQNMFTGLINPAEIEMQNVVLPVDNVGKNGSKDKLSNAFVVTDFAGNSVLVVIANAKDGNNQALAALNKQTWNDHGATVTGRQNSDYFTYVNAVNRDQVVGHVGLDFVYTSPAALEQYLKGMTSEAEVNHVLGDLADKWDAQQDTEHGYLKPSLRLMPVAGASLVQLMTSKYELHFKQDNSGSVVPTPTPEPQPEPVTPQPQPEVTPTQPEEQPKENDDNNQSVVPKGEAKPGKTAAKSKQATKTVAPKANVAPVKTAKTAGMQKLSSVKTVSHASAGQVKTKVTSKQNALPQTGEKQNILAAIGAGLLAMLGLGLLVERKRRN